jgi:hypothetical protein
MLSILVGNLALAAVGQREIEAPPPKPAIVPGGVWLSEPPSDCPFKPSDTMKALRFTGRHAEYTGADTWYPSWASDGSMYSPFTDGAANGVFSGSGYNFVPKQLAVPVTGFAAIEGSDPLNLQITRAGVIPREPFPYGGQYPCGSLVHNGIWYYGSYALDWLTGPPNYPWGKLGPFVGFSISRDLGKTWLPETRTAANPLFGESAKNGKPVDMFGKAKEYKQYLEAHPETPGVQVKIGAPHFVDFGRNMEHSPDGKAYLVAHGAARPQANNSWSAGDQIYLLRVKPGPETINDPKAYEFFAGQGKNGEPLWTSDFQAIRPLLEWDDHMGIVTATYNAPLKRFLMCVTDGRGPDGISFGPFDTYILESPTVTGPWKLMVYMRKFGEQAYFVNFPSRFIGSDGRNLWLCYSHGYEHSRANPPGGRYAMCLQEVNLLSPGDPVPPPSPPGPLDREDNVARKAVVTVSSTHPDYTPRGVVDGNVGGFPGDTSEEWASQGEKDTAMLRLNWAEPQTIARVWLFDRPCNTDQITSAMLVFSDGTTVQVGALPDDARKGIEVKFEPKTVKWLAVIVTGVGPKTANIGLSEIAVFSDRFVDQARQVPLGVLRVFSGDNNSGRKRKIVANRNP